ncbi:Family of unknown function (DUF648) [Chlamydia serpentis]|uniref:Uncharacterized protein n=1 Tax=Chlamydia serpentis TaxID=1967782 RepID=A0A2R8FAH0_9CHLA|nr:DUF648 domain-containing protein [Chlamydia serpentis]SPN73322.1 Family of unknown function (DUF648) [Chlamydia serpentis]
MKTYNFSPSINLSWSESLMVQLDSYFFLGGQKTKVIAITPSGLRFCSTSTNKISTTQKILKILSFIFFPIVLIVLALRYFLHLKFENREVFSTPAWDPLIEEALEKHPVCIEESFISANPVFFAFPKTMRYLRVRLPQDSSVPQITHCIQEGIVKLSSLIDLTKIPWSTDCLHLDMVASKSNRLLVNRLIKEECSPELSDQGKQLLLQSMLQHLFITGVKQDNPGTNPQGPRLTLFPETVKKDGQLKKTFWFSIFFDKENLQESPGVMILKQLYKLGVDLQTILPFEENPNLARVSTEGGLRIYWESRFQSVLQDYGYTFK